MFDFTVDRLKAKELARDFGFKVSFNVPSPGIKINNGGDSIFLGIKDLFPELNSLKGKNYVNGEYSLLQEIADEIVIVVKKHSSIDITEKYKKYSFYNVNAA
ncbi:MAG: hypothetical protein ACOX6Z_00860 [Dethiobacteria bacterium]|jgi:hypothetical protein